MRTLIAISLASALLAGPIASSASADGPQASASATACTLSAHD